ncbi:hypothetical protein DL240_13745 [Lujinxingia litoralis]|uniref:Glycerol-3-phosphate dehydrogenase n=1 Tax=Lujinxingia litoralis TaxID=2211119 RepID=A0A328C356_9DELT|nr:hypothetical protein [Lujinxingia litoralis]RAL21191.1 hypothetical protein DL240_13745 [Lujinxingia litoralis]
MISVGFVGSTGVGEVARHVLARGQCQVKVWHPGESSDEDVLPGQRVELAELAEATLIVFSAPAASCRFTARKLGDVLTGRHVIVHTLRDLEPGTLKCVSTILEEETPTRRIGYLGGPMLGVDVEAGRPASAVCASLFPEVHDLVEDAMMSENFRVYRSQDLIGAQVCGAYSRVIALLSGLADALQLGSSLQATLFARGLAEMSRFVVFRQGFERTAFGLAGAGALYADTHLTGSVDFQIGRHLGKEPGSDVKGLVKRYGPQAKELLELLAALASSAEHADLELHLLEGAAALAHGELQPQEIVQRLMTLSSLYE